MTEDEIQSEHDGPWWAGLVKCDTCLHRWVAVVPVEYMDPEPATALQCPSCENMSGYPVEFNDEEIPDCGD